MTDNIAPPSRQALQAKTASRPNRVTGALKIACDAIVFEGTPWNEAARQAGLTVRSMRLALERPHVLRYLREQKEVLRASLCAQNPRRLAQLRDQDDNRAAAVHAIRALEQLGESAVAPGSEQKMPGLTITIVAREPAKIIDITPSTPNDETGGLYRITD